MIRDKAALLRLVCLIESLSSTAWGMKTRDQGYWFSRQLILKSLAPTSGGGFPCRVNDLKYLAMLIRLLIPKALPKARPNSQIRSRDCLNLENVNV